MEPRTSFVGRDDELERLDELVRSTQLVTLTGPGGVGKTRLAMKVGARLADEVIGEIHLVELAPLPVGSGVAPLSEVVVATLGYPTLASAREDLVDKPTLIILDNCEHVSISAATVADELLENLPLLRLLVTSRAPLGLEGEHVVVVEPLPEDDAVNLLVDRARAAGASFPDGVLDDGLRELCAQLDGLPLALELVASHLRSLQPDDVIGGLSQNAALLRRARGGFSRHLSIEDAVSWSYRLLDEPLAKFFRSLSVFPGGFGLGDVEAVLGAEFGSRIEIADSLDRLVGHSLVQTDNDTMILRYRLLVPVRSLARQWLEEDGSAAHLDGLLVDYLVDRAVDIAAAGMSSWDDAIMRDLFRLSPDFRAAIRTCLASDEESTRAFCLYLPSWGVVHHGEVGAISRVGRELLDRWPARSAPLWAEVAAIASTAHLGAGDLDAADALARDVLETTTDPSVATVVAGRTRCLVDVVRGDFEHGLHHAEVAAGWARSLGLDLFAYELDCHRGGILDLLGRSEEARSTLLSVLENSRAAHASVVATAALQLLAENALESDLDQALGYLDEISAILTPGSTIDATWSERLTRGSVELRRGNTAAALEAMGEALRLARRAGDRRDSWRAMRSIGVAVALGVPERRADAARLLAAVQESALTPAQGMVGRDLLELALEAVSNVPSRPQPSGDEAVALAIDLSSLGLSPREASPSSPSPTPTMTFNATGVRISWLHDSTDLRPMKGLRDLAQLLRYPGRDVHVLELMGSSLDESGSGPTIDNQARRAYEDRLRELQTEIHEAEDNNDSGALERAQDEFDVIVGVLSESLGLDGRAREKGSSAEKARQAVSWRIRAAIRKIEDQLPACGRHLARSVQTGGFCRYDPESDPGWSID